MALPAYLLDRLSAVTAGGTTGSRAGVRLAEAPEKSGEGWSTREPGEQGLRLGIDGLDAVLPDRGLLRGGVVELSVAGDGALATSIALAACRAAQRETSECGGSLPWCAFVDPSSTLYGPGVSAAQVALERLLVVRPPLEALSRVALRLAESQVFAVLVIDTIGMPGHPLSVPLGAWPRVIRRLSLAVEGTAASVLLLTSLAERRPLPLPVAQRIELRRPAQDKLIVRVAKDKRGRIAGARPVAWTRAPAAAEEGFSHVELGRQR